jgi:hypothetical protein
MTDPNINNDNAIDPVMSDLSLEDQAQLFQLLKVEAGMTLTMRKNGAVADGVDVDIAQACFNNMDESTKPLVVDYTIESGTAVFKNDDGTTSKSIRKHTNKSLSSTVQLINLTPGKGMIKATPYLNPKMAPAPVEYEFIGKPRKLRLVLTANPDNQLANGVATDGVIATLTDENNNNEPVINEKLEFKLYGNAKFKGDNLVTTDKNGKATVLLTSSANANIDITVTCTVISESTVTQKIVIKFIGKPKIVLTITENDQYSDGVGKNIVLAKITDSNGKPIGGALLELKLTGDAIFNDGPTMGEYNANKDGLFNAGIRSTANANISVKYTVTLVSDRSVTASVYVNFKAKVAAKPQFKVIRKKDTAVTSMTDYGYVCAVITLPAGAPAQKYTVHFKKYTNPYYEGTFRNYGITKTKSWGNTSALDIPVTAAGGVTNVDAWIWWADGTDFTKDGHAFFQADLLDANGQVLYSNILGAWTTFTGQARPVTPPPPPPPPPSVPNWPITLVVGQSEGIYGPSIPISNTYYRCAVHIQPNSVPDRQFTVSIVANGQYFALSHANGPVVQSLTAYANETLDLGILKNMPSDLGVTIEVRAAQGVVWRSIVYPRSLRNTIIR